MEKFKTIVSSDLATETNVQQWFQSMSEILLSPTTRLVALDPNDHVHLFQLVEIEFYLYDAVSHPDLYAHRRPIQLHTFGHWYFHSIGQKETNYKGGSYKGIDLTFGAKSKVMGGILFRSMLPVSARNSGQTAEKEAKSQDGFIEGPSKLVDRLLQVAQKDSIAALVASCSDSGAMYIDALDPRSRLRLEMQEGLQEHDGLKLVCGPRVGLSLSHVDEPIHFEYLFKPYRFVNLAYLKRIKKLIGSLIIATWIQENGLHATNTQTRATIEAAFSTAILERWAASFQHGSRSLMKRKRSSPTTSISEYLAWYGKWCAIHAHQSRVTG